MPGTVRSRPATNHDPSSLKPALRALFHLTFVCTEFMPFLLAAPCLYDDPAVDQYLIINLIVKALEIDIIHLLH